MLAGKTTIPTASSLPTGGACNSPQRLPCSPVHSVLCLPDKAAQEGRPGPVPGLSLGHPSSALGASLVTCRDFWK